MDKLIQHLPQILVDLFHSVHATHLKAMGTEEQAKRSLDNVTRVSWDKEQQALRVYYTDGEWWYYGSDGEWF